MITRIDVICKCGWFRTKYVTEDEPGDFKHETQNVAYCDCCSGSPQVPTALPKSRRRR